MGVANKTLEKVLLGNSDSNIRFQDLRGLLISLGFSERIKGSHHIFAKSGVQEILNIQPLNTSAKPYQVKQVRNLILRYRLAGDSQ